MAQRFAARSPTAASEDIGVEQLEADKTAALTRMHPADVGAGIAGSESPAVLDRTEELAALGEGVSEDNTAYQARINSIESSLDGSVATFEGEIQVEEFLNNEFISRITIMVSIEGEESMTIGDVEARLLREAHGRLRAAASLTPERFEASLKQTRRDEDVA